MLKQLQGVASILQSVRLTDLWRYVTPAMVAAFNGQVARKVPIDSAMVDAVVGLLEREAEQQAKTAFAERIRTAITAQGDSTVLMQGLGRVGINYLWDHYRAFGDETILKFLRETGTRTRAQWPPPPPPSHSTPVA
eukprot:m51a1_g13504 hypothetical protein (136) ;mRNA; f:383-851